MKIRISDWLSYEKGIFSDKTFTTQSVFGTNAEGAFSDPFLFRENPRGFISDIKTFYPNTRLEGFQDSNGLLGSPA
jgi:hypothetical protein